MSCDNELANEWARCSGKNASYLTMVFMSHLIGLARFCESIVDYVANAENAPYPDISVDRFYGEISSAYDILFTVWIKANEPKVHTTVCVCNLG